METLEGGCGGMADPFNEEETDREESYISETPQSI